MTLRRTLAIGLAVALTAASNPLDAQVQVRGRMLLGTDAFPEASATEMTLGFEPRLRYALPDGSLLSLSPRGWVDLAGAGRTVLDPVRFEWTKALGEWEIMLGSSEVSWGVMESHRAVDIVNQQLPTSRTGSVTKLAQPMARVTLIQPWGTVTGFALPGFRERPYVGMAGTPWSGLSVNDDRPIMEERGGSPPIDWAARWSHELGSLEVAMSHFSGRSRDPILVSHQVDSETALSPLHEMTNQTSLEVQWTSGRWLLKGEGLTRTWGGERIGALAVGAEYVLFDYFSLFLEYLSDSRGSDAPTSYENDIFLGGRVMFDGGSLSVGAFLDTESGNRLGRATLLRSLTDRMAVRLEATWFGGDPLAEPSNALRHDSSLSVALVARL